MRPPGTRPEPRPNRNWNGWPAGSGSWPYWPAGDRAGLAAEIGELTRPVVHGYDRYICIWAAYVDALIDRDGPAMRRWMDRQHENVLGSGLRENWLTCSAMRWRGSPTGLTT